MRLPTPPTSNLDIRAQETRTHVLPALPYGYDALEPVIDTRTMMLHHGKHHASYVAKLNSAVEDFPELAGRDALWLLHNLDRVPREIRTSVRNNAGGHVNHCLFWQVMSSVGSSAPTGALAAAIDREFGGLEQFKVRFAAAGNAVFASGWVWLVTSAQNGGRLEIRATSGHDNPVTQGHTPILVNDVWEHAYYLKYENRRADYLQAWWTVVDWLEAGRRFETAHPAAEQTWENEGGLIGRVMQ